MVAKYLESQKRNSESYQSVNIEIPEGTTLPKALAKIQTFMKDRYGLNEKILKSLDGTSNTANALLTSCPDIASMNFAEYFESKF